MLFPLNTWKKSSPSFVGVVCLWIFGKRVPQIPSFPIATFVYCSLTITGWADYAPCLGLPYRYVAFSCGLRRRSSSLNSLDFSSAIATTWRRLPHSRDPEFCVVGMFMCFCLYVVCLCFSIIAALCEIWGGLSSCFRL